MWHTRLQRLRQPIRIGIVGMGAMGKGLLYQAQHTPGIECVAVADIRLDRAIACAESLSQPYEVAQTPGAL